MGVQVVRRPGTPSPSHDHELANLGDEVEGEVEAVRETREHLGPRVKESPGGWRLRRVARGRSSGSRVSEAFGGLAWGLCLREEVICLLLPDKHRRKTKIAGFMLGASGGCRGVRAVHANLQELVWRSQASLLKRARKASGTSLAEVDWQPCSRSSCPRRRRQWPGPGVV